jgi:hypothetical protein
MSPIPSLTIFSCHKEDLSKIDFATNPTLNIKELNRSRIKVASGCEHIRSSNKCDKGFCYKLEQVPKYKINALDSPLSEDVGRRLMNFCGTRAILRKMRTYRRS